MSQPSTEISVVNDANQLLESWGFSRGRSRFHSSITGTSPQDQARKLLLLNSEGEDILPYVGKRLSIVAFMFRPVSKADRTTGEMTQLLLVQLLTADGKVINSFSSFVLEDLLDAATMFGMPSVEKPFSVVPRTRGKAPNVSHCLDTTDMAKYILESERKA